MILAFHQCRSTIVQNINANLRICEVFSPEDSNYQIPFPPGQQRCQMPGVCPGGGMLKLRFDRYIDPLHKWRPNLNNNT